MSTQPTQPPARGTTRGALRSRSRAPVVWIAIPLAILVAFAIGFTLRAVL
jgi:hypothetical protein